MSSEWNKGQWRMLMEKRFKEVVSPSTEQMNTREEMGETAETAWLNNLKISIPIKAGI